MGRRRSEAALFDFVAELYRAAGDPTRWPEVLARFPTVIDCAGVTLYAVDERDQSVPFMVNYQLPEVMEHEYRAYYLTIDPRPRCALAHRNRPVYDYLHSTERDIDRSEYYDWHRRRAGFRYYIGAVLAEADDLATYIGVGVQRTPRQGHVNAHEIELFGRLLPHLRQAVALSTKFAELRARSGALADTLHESGTAMLLLDRRGQIVFATAAAEQMLNANDGLHVDRESRLRAGRPSDDAALQRLIAGVAVDDVAAPESAGGEVALSRRSGLPPFVVRVRRLGAPDALCFVSRPVFASVTIRDPGAVTRLGPRSLQSVFGLTPAEAALASAVAAGADLKTYADEAGISRETARWHLKNVFSKTETSKQTELVRLLLNAAPAQSS